MYLYLKKNQEVSSHYPDFTHLYKQTDPKMDQKLSWHVSLQYKPKNAVYPIMPQYFLHQYGFGL